MAVRVVCVCPYVVCMCVELGWVLKSELGIGPARLFTGWTPFLSVAQPAPLRHWSWVKLLRIQFQLLPALWTDRVSITGASCMMCEVQILGCLLCECLTHLAVTVVWFQMKSAPISDDVLQGNCILSGRTYVVYSRIPHLLSSHTITVTDTIYIIYKNCNHFI